jgi:hypothetical protein
VPAPIAAAPIAPATAIPAASFLRFMVIHPSACEFREH